MSRNYPEWSTRRTQEKMNVHLQNICRCISKQRIGHKRGFCSFVNCWRCGRQAKSSRESRWHYVRILTKKKKSQISCHKFHHSKHKTRTSKTQQRNKEKKAQERVHKNTEQTYLQKPVLRSYEQINKLVPYLIRGKDN